MQIKRTSFLCRENWTPYNTRLWRETSSLPLTSELTGCLQLYGRVCGGKWLPTPKLVQNSSMCKSWKWPTYMMMTHQSQLCGLLLYSLTVLRNGKHVGVSECSLPREYTAECFQFRPTRSECPTVMTFSWCVLRTDPLTSHDRMHSVR